MLTTLSSDVTSTSETATTRSAETTHDLVTAQSIVDEESDRYYAVIAAVAGAGVVVICIVLLGHYAWTHRQQPALHPINAGTLFDIDVDDDDSETVPKTSLESDDLETTEPIRRRPAEQLPAVPRPDAPRSAEQPPVAPRPAEQPRPAEPRPAEPPPAAPRPAAPRPDAPRSAEQPPVAPRPAEQPPAVPRSTAPRPAEQPRPAEPRPAEPPPAAPRSDTPQPAAQPEHTADTIDPPIASDTSQHLARDSSAQARSLTPAFDESFNIDDSYRQDSTLKASEDSTNSASFDHVRTSTPERYAPELSSISTRTETTGASNPGSLTRMRTPNEGDITVLSNEDPPTLSSVGTRTETTGASEPGSFSAAESEDEEIEVFNQSGYWLRKQKRVSYK